MQFDLNTDAMSRETLEAKYFDAIQIIETMGFGDKSFVADACAVFEIPLGQAKVLDALLPGRVLSSDRILEITHGLQAGDIGSKTVDVQISRLLKSLKPLNVKITTMWGVGYQIEPDHRSLIIEAIGQYRQSRKQQTEGTNVE